MLNGRDLAPWALATTLACGMDISTELGPHSASVELSRACTAHVSGDREFALDYAGHARSYILHVPVGAAADQPIPLVLVLHGLSMDGPQMRVMSAFDAVADVHGFATVYPTSDSGSWNAGGCCNSGGPDDVEFVRTLLKDVQRRECIDAKRIYATGMSNGSLLSNRLGCDAADLFAAIAPVSGPLVIPDEQCKPLRPISVLAVNGSLDTLLGYDEAGYLSWISDPGTPVPGAHAAIASWARRDQCSATASAPTPKSAWPDHPLSGGIIPGAGGWIPDEFARNSAPMTPGASCEWYPGCEAGSEVGLCTHDGGHDWATGTSAAVWDFFARHPMP